MLYITHTPTRTYLPPSSIPCSQFALENEQLFEQVTTMVDEVRQIEGKVIEISKLQELFSEKVLQQVNNVTYTLPCSLTATCIYLVFIIML